MTDRIKGLTVTLEKDIRVDDCEVILNAIRMVRGVASVATHVSDTDHYFAKEQLKSEFKEKIWKLTDSL